MRRHRIALIAGVLLVAFCTFFPTLPLVTADDDDTFTMPKPVHIVRPDYPDEAREAGAGGRVTVEVRVSVEGDVCGVSIKEDETDHRSLAQSALEAALRWRFEPAEQDSEPIEVTILIPFEFNLE